MYPELPFLSKLNTMTIRQSLYQFFPGLNRFRPCRLLILIMLMYIFCLITLLEKYQFWYQGSGYGDPLRVLSRDIPHNCTFELLKQGYIVERNISTWQHGEREWKAAAEIETNKEQILPSKAEEPKLLSCANLSQLELGPQLGKGVTKEVFKSSYRGKDVAVKMITPNVEDVKACLRREKFHKQEECYLYANYKLLKEITLSLQLNHPNILKVLGYCVRSEQTSTSLKDHGVILVSELGHKVGIHHLVKKSSWTKRVQHSIDLMDLMDYLEHSPVGSLGIWDFKLTQFMLVNGTIRLNDLDDLSAGEPPCTITDDCRIKKHEVTVDCIDNRCLGYNARYNLIQCTHTFLETFLAYSPMTIRLNVTDIMDRIRSLTYDARQASDALSSVLRYL